MSLLDGELFGKKSEEAKYKFLMKLYDIASTPDIINFITELTPEEIENTVIIDYEERLIKNDWKIDLDSGVNEAVLLYMKRKISRKRSGRTEAIDVLKADIMSMIHNRSITDRFLGRTP